MKMKKDKEKKFNSKPLLNSQAELMAMKFQAVKQIISVLKQKQADLQNSINLIALELGVPENQLGKWGLSEDGKTLLKVGKKSGPLFKTVKKREKKKKMRTNNDKK